MSDIVERLRTFLGNGIGEDAAKESESLRQRVAELEKAHMDFGVGRLPVGTTIPEGWQLVPIEPTDKMREFIWDCYCDGQIDTYRSMLAAAPAGPRPADYKPEDVK